MRLLLCCVLAMCAACATMWGQQTESASVMQCGPIFDAQGREIGGGCYLIEPVEFPLVRRTPVRLEPLGDGYAWWADDNPVICDKDCIGQEMDLDVGMGPNMAWGINAANPAYSKTKQIYLEIDAGVCDQLKPLVISDVKIVMSADPKHALVVGDIHCEDVK